MISKIVNVFNYELDLKAKSRDIHLAIEPYSTHKDDIMGESPSKRVCFDMDKNIIH